MSVFSYLSTTTETENNYLNVGELHFKQLELNEDTKRKIDKQLSDWEIHIYHQWYREDLCRDDIDEGKSTRVVPVKNMVDMQESFSSNDVVGAYLIENCEFLGVIIKFSSYSSFGMSSKSGVNYCILKTNGEIIGNNSNRSGHCSTEVDEWSYTVYSLKRKV